MSDTKRATRQTLFMLRLICVAFFFCSTLTMAQGQPQPLSRAPLQPLTPSQRGVVFKSAQAREFGKQCSRASPTGYWTPVAPSQVEIKRLEAALPRFMAARKTSRWSGRFGDFHFQYGALVRGKKRLIYVNALIDESILYRGATENGKPLQPDPRQMWRRVPEVVCDGGPNFWGVEFDPQTAKFQNASFNGMI